jgi:carbamoyl-phosphate synthase large subunit
MSADPVPVKVLTTFAGRKSYILRALAASRWAGHLVAVDADPEATVRHVAHRFVTVPPLAEPAAYVAALLALCDEERFDCLIPLNDLDLPLLARHRDDFAARGVRLLSAPLEVVDILRDKHATAGFLERHGLRSPRTALAEAGDLALPLIAKQRFGQGSQGLRVCREPRDLETLGADMIVQELLAGPEYNLDILRAADGSVLSVVPKLKLAMAYGSTDRARSVEAPELIEVGIRLAEAVGHVGTIDVDLMVVGGEIFVLDVNARIGGGFPFTALVCPEYADLLLRVGRGESPAPILGRYRRDVTIAREFVYRQEP